MDSKTLEIALEAIDFLSEVGQWNNFVIHCEQLRVKNYVFSYWILPGACYKCWAFLFAHVRSNLYFCETN
jgi:hypothetical protein